MFCQCASTPTHCTLWCRDLTAHFRVLLLLPVAAVEAAVANMSPEARAEIAPTLEGVRNTTAALNIARSSLNANKAAGKK